MERRKGRKEGEIQEREELASWAKLCEIVATYLLFHRGEWDMREEEKGAKRRKVHKTVQKTTGWKWSDVKSAERHWNVKPKTVSEWKRPLVRCGLVFRRLLTRRCTGKYNFQAYTRYRVYCIVDTDLEKIWTLFGSWAKFLSANRKRLSQAPSNAQSQSTSAPRTKTISEDENYNPFTALFVPICVFLNRPLEKKKRSKKMKRVLTLQCEHHEAFTPFFKWQKWRHSDLVFLCSSPFPPLFPPFLPPPSFFSGKS